MKIISKIALSALTIAAIAGSTLESRAAHESNNYVELNSGDSDAGGAAVVNYVAGKSKQAEMDIFTASTMIFGLPAGEYVFAVRFNSGGDIRDFQEICTLVSDGEDTEASCGDGQLPLGGFHEGAILDMDENIVLSGFFERRGGNRHKE